MRVLIRHCQLFAKTACKDLNVTEAFLLNLNAQVQHVFRAPHHLLVFRKHNCKRLIMAIIKHVQMFGRTWCTNYFGKSKLIQYQTLPSIAVTSDFVVPPSIFAVICRVCSSESSVFFHTFVIKQNVFPSSRAKAFDDIR